MGVQVREKLKDSGVWWLFHCQNKKRKSVRVGSYEAALETKKIIEARIALGQDPFPQLEPEPVSAPTLREWYEGYKKRILTSAAKPHGEAIPHLSIAFCRYWVMFPSIS